MAKEAPEKKSKKDKKERKEKKEKRAEVDGVVKVKKEKKEKKVKKDRKSGVAEKLLEELQDVSMVEDGGAGPGAGAGDVVMEVNGVIGAVVELENALVPFAYPLAEEAKEVKRILRTVKKSAKTKTLRRGVKEVVKSLRKSPTSEPSSSSISNPSAIVIIAADISPMDVVSHLPVLCEDHNIPYIYVKSRAELGEASATKRPTSVVMVGRERNKKAGGKEVKESEVLEFEEAYEELVRVVGKASRGVRK